MEKKEAREQKVAGAAIEERVGDVKEIFGASFSRKGTLNSALINLKEQELLEVKVIQAFSFVFSI